MKRIALLFVFALIPFCAHTEDAPFTVAVERSPGYGVNLIFTTSSSAVGFVGEIQYQTTVGGPVHEQAFFAHRYRPTGGYLMQPIGDYSSIYVTVREVMALGSNAVVFGN